MSKLHKKIKVEFPLEKIPLLPPYLRAYTFKELTRSYKVYKAVEVKYGSLTFRTICTLILPAGTIIYVGIKKMRASQAIVACFNDNVETAYSMLYPSFTYEIGDMVFPLDKFSFEKETCASGIHFFRTKAEADDYIL